MKHLQQHTSCGALPLCRLQYKLGNAVGSGLCIYHKRVNMYVLTIQECVSRRTELSITNLLQYHQQARIRQWCSCIVLMPRQLLNTQYW
jgi:hypothetical protein